MLEVSNNNVNVTNNGETVGRNPHEDLVIDNNLFYQNETPDDSDQVNQNSSRPLNKNP